MNDVPSSWLFHIAGARTWLEVLRRYLAFIVPANLPREIAHLPPYTI